MKNTFLNTIGLLVLTFIMLFATQATLIAQEPGTEEGVMDAASEGWSANDIVGVWETSVQPRNCDTGDPLGLPFLGVSTYNKGGTTAEFGANPAAPYRTAGHGIWEPLRRKHRYSLAFTFLALTPSGAVVGRMRVEQTMELSRNGNTFESRGSFVLRNPNGDILGTGCSTATARRFE